MIIGTIMAVFMLVVARHYNMKYVLICAINLGQLMTITNHTVLYSIMSPDLSRFKSTNN